MLRTLSKTSTVAVADHPYAVRYFNSRTLRGGRRYSAEILLGPDDRIILDDDSVTNLEAKTTRLVPATLYSRLLAGKTTAAWGVLDPSGRNGGVGRRPAPTAPAALFWGRAPLGCLPHRRVPP